MDTELKVALITGASSGIGAATAIEYACKGIRLTITGRNPDRLESVAEQCQKAGLSSQELLVVTGDVRIDEFVKSLIKRTVDKFGRLDILVNNAGGASTENTVMNGSLEQYDTIMHTNLRAPILFTKEAVPYLEKSKGCIVNVSSMFSKMAIQNQTFYTISKAGLDQLTKCTSTELAAKKIRVNSVNPGAIDTNIYQSLGLDRETYDKFLEGWRQIQPLKVGGQSENVAKAIVFLTSEDARCITGINLPVDGGCMNVVPLPEVSSNEEV